MSNAPGATVQPVVKDSRCVDPRTGPQPEHWDETEKKAGRDHASLGILGDHSYFKMCGRKKCRPVWTISQASSKDRLRAKAKRISHGVRYTGTPSRVCAPPKKETQVQKLCKAWSADSGTDAGQVLLDGIPPLSGCRKTLNSRRRLLCRVARELKSLANHAKAAALTERDS